MSRRFPKVARRGAGALLLGLGLLAAALPAAAAEPDVPEAARSALGLQRLAGGAWLVQDKRGVRLLDAEGRERAAWSRRVHGFDLRPSRDGAYAVTVESDTQRVWRIDVDPTQWRLQARPLVEPPPYAVEALCLWRDARGLDHVFLIGEDGLSGQWLLGEPAARAERPLALPAGSTHCAVDDAGGRVYVLHPDTGVWSLGADAEGRHPPTLALPGGAGAAAPRALAVAPGALLLAGREGVQAYRLTDAEADPAIGEPARQWAEALRDKEPVLTTWPAGLPTLAPGAGGAAASVDSAVARRDGKRWRVESLPAAPPAPATAALPVVTAAVQTEPVDRYGDAADDPALWIDPRDPARARVLGTNKRHGLHVYDLAGRERQMLPVGRLNNVDLRQRVRLGGRERDLAVATHRDEAAVVVFEVGRDGRVTDVGRVPTGLDDVYGVCVHRPRAGGLEVFVNDKDGRYLRIALEAQGTGVSGRVVQRFKLGSQPEACVADDEGERLYLGEEQRGVWTMPIGPAAGLSDTPALTLAVPVGGLLQRDVEGLGLYLGREGRYLVVSSQGSDSYVVTDADPPYRVRGAFRIGLDAQRGIDAVSETDGLEVTATPLGARFPAGVLIVQDGHKRLPAGPQNFKLVDWREVARVLRLP